MVSSDALSLAFTGALALFVYFDFFVIICFFVLFFVFFVLFFVGGWGKTPNLTIFETVVKNAGWEFSPNPQQKQNNKYKKQNKKQIMANK